MASLNGLPAFFQATTKTVLDELADFELGGLDEELEIEVADQLEAFDDANIGNGFGDLDSNNLPDFFKNPSALEQDNYDLLDSMANQTLDEDYVASVLPPGARASTAYPPSYPAKSAAQSLPPGLSTSKPAEAVAPPHYKQLFGLGGGAAAPAPTVAPVTSAPPNLTKPAAAPSSISYARALAPSAPSAPQQTVQALPTPPQGVSHLPYPGSQQTMAPAPSVTCAAGAFMNAHPAYILNPPPPPVTQPAGILRGTSGASTQSGVTVGSAHTHSSAFSSQKPLLFNSATGFSTPAEGSTKPGVNPSQQHRKELPRGKYMSPSDVRYVVNKVLQPMETTDPFADDFYFLQLSIKKNAAAREAAVKEQAAMPSSIYVPLPVWKETKERIKLQMDSSRRACHDKSREWETKEQVLGHQVRSDIHRPREQLRMPSLQELDQYNSAEAADQDGDIEDFSEMKNPFSSRLWTMRQAVQRGYEALYTVQELQHLLSSPLIASNPTAHGEIVREIESAVSLLSQAIGIRTLSATPRPTASPNLGLLGGEEEQNFSLDGGHVGAILQTTIGKKLMTRSLKLLTPPHRWALLPVILAKILLSPPAADPTVASSSSSGAANEALAVEQRLLRTIIEFLQYSYQYQVDSQRQVPPGAVAVFTNILLTNLRQCIKSVMVTQMEKSKLRQALISDRTRAEVMHMIVQIGDKVSVLADRRLSEEWAQTREAFMSMLDN